MRFRFPRVPELLTRLAGDVAGASAVEDGIMLGILGSVLFFAFRGPFFDLCRAVTQFLGQP